MNREDFPILNEKIIYFDNAATTFKPEILTIKTNEYYHKHCSNIHRGSYDIGMISENLYEETRKKVAKFIGADSQNEIVFTSNTTDSLNKIIFGFFLSYLKSDDEILTTKSEHASNLLPWFELSRINNCKIKYLKLDDEYKVNIENLKKAITNKTKVISIAHITNVVGDIRPIKEICEVAHELGILVVVDAAQSIAHMPVNVKDFDIDFLAFSAHKMCGPTGIGVLYAKEKYLNHIKPLIFGGGMNDSFTEEGICIYNDIPYLLEAGTPNIAGVIGFGAIIDYLNNIGMANIYNYEKELKDYAVNKLENIDGMRIYNKNSESGIIIINYKNIPPYELASYLNKHNICVRAGKHCVKILGNILEVDSTCRISLYFYNTKEEIDNLVEVLKNL